ncbi:MAG: MbnP family copper-binding protein [Myxococcota bacterium]
MSFDLEVSLLVSGVEARCSTQLDEVGLNSLSAELADARFYLSAIEARNDEGRWIPVELEQDGKWQYENVVLLDFEDGQGSCASSGTTDMNSRVRGRLPDADYDRLRFSVGVPFELNHLDDASAPAPLNSPGMFWAWQDGYKFLRLDWTPNSSSRWNFHLGSRGCDNGGQPNSAPPVRCDRPNRPRIELGGFGESSTLRVDAGALVKHSALDSNLAGSPPGCMSSPSEPSDCEPVYEALGIDFLTGTCISGCEEQRVFSLHP